MQIQFSENLRKLRKSKNLSQQLLAKALNISRQALTTYEVGTREPSLEVLIRIADYFNVSTDFLLGRKQAVIDQRLDIVVENIRKIIGTMPLPRFIQEVGQKTGILIPIDKMESYLNKKITPDSVTLRILAMYIDKDVEYFLKEQQSLGH